MTIPDFQTIMLPLLKLMSDGNIRPLANLRESLSGFFGLSEDERVELLPSGTQPVFDNRVAWATIYLHKAVLLERPKRGCYKITERGLAVFEEDPKKIDIKFLQKFSEFQEFRNKKKKEPPTNEDDQAEINPAEALENAYQEIQKTLAFDLLQTIKDCTPAFFERLVIDVLIKMGYGGSRREAGQAMGKSGDGGIDGIIKEDKLGLDIIYIQAKRWEGSVGRPEIQKFAGALQGQRARKGIFITTSSFTKDALDYVLNIDSKIILIDGERLAELMIENNVGVSSIGAYEIKKIDSDYFLMSRTTRLPHPEAVRR